MGVIKGTASWQGLEFAAGLCPRQPCGWTDPRSTGQELNSQSPREMLLYLSCFCFIKEQKDWGGRTHQWSWAIILMHLWKILHTSQGPGLGKKMGPMNQESGTELTTACGPRGKGWFSYITNENVFISVYSYSYCKASITRIQMKEVIWFLLKNFSYPWFLVTTRCFHRPPFSF